MLNINPTTYGNTPACVWLVDLLNKHNAVPLSQGIARILNGFNADMANIMKMPGRSTRHQVMLFWRDRTIDMARTQLGPMFEETGISIDILANVITGKYRQMVEKGDLWEKLAYGPEGAPDET